MKKCAQREKFFYERGRKSYFVFKKIDDDKMIKKRQLKSLNSNISYENPNLIDEEQKKSF